MVFRQYWSHWLRWLLAIDTNDPVRRALNRGLAVILWLWVVPTGVGLVLLIALHVPIYKIVLLGSLLIVLMVAWRLNRQGTAHGAAFAILGGMLTLPALLDPSTYTAPWGQPIFVPVLYAVPIAMAALFVAPRFGVWAAAIQMVVVIGYMFILGIPLGWIFNFGVFGTLNFAILTVILVSGASIFTRKLSEAALANAALQQLTADLDRQVEERTSDLQHQKAMVEASNHQLRTYMLQVEELAVEQERMRVAREIHDGLGHHLNNIKVHSEVAHRSFAAHPATALDALTTVKTEIKNAQRELRRAIDALVADTHAASTLEELLDCPIRDCSLAGITVDCSVTGTPRLLPQQVTHALFRIGQEALTNIRRHAHATSAAVRVDYQEQRVHILIEDDGMGMPGVEPRRGHGRSNLQERAALVGGTTVIETRPGQGVRIVVEVPA